MTFTPTKELTAIMAENNVSSSEIATWGTELEAYIENSYLPLSGGTISGPLAIRPGSAPTTLGLDVSRALTGSSSVGINTTLFNITSDDTAVSGANFINYYTFQGSFGGASTQGGRQGIFALLTQTAATSASSSNRNYVAGSFFIQSDSGDGGADLSSGAKGAYFAINPYALLTNGATNTYNVSGGEINFGVETGASTRYLTGLQIVTHARHRVSGSAADAMLLFGAQSGAADMNAGIVFASINGKFPLAATASLLSLDAATLAYGIDLRGLTATTALVAGPNMLLTDSSLTIGSGGAGSIIVNSEGGTVNGDLILSPAGSGAVRFGVADTGVPTLTNNFIMKLADGTAIRIPYGLV